MLQQDIPLTAEADQFELIGSISRLREVWPQIEPLVQKSIDTGNGEFEPNDLFVMGIALSAQFAVRWECGVPTMVMVWEYLRYPKFMVGNILALGGDHGHEFMARFWDYALDTMKRQGAKYVECFTYPKLSAILRRRYKFNLNYHHLRRVL